MGDHQRIPTVVCKRLFTIFLTLVAPSSIEFHRASLPPARSCNLPGFSPPQRWVIRKGQVMSILSSCTPPQKFLTSLCHLIQDCASNYQTIRRIFSGKSVASLLLADDRYQNQFLERSFAPLPYFKALSHYQHHAHPIILCI